MSEILGSLFKYFMAALAIVGVVAVASKAMSSDKVGTAISDTTQMATNIRATFSGNAAGFTNLTTARVASGQLAPDGMIVAGALKNPWDGDVTAVGTGTNNMQFTVTHPKVPSDACPKLAASQTGLSTVTINGTSTPVPVDSGLAISLCNGANNSNSIVFTYNR